MARAAGIDRALTPPGGRTPLGPLFALDALTALTVGILPPLLPAIVGEFALSSAQAGLVNTAYAVGRLAGSYPTARFRAARGTRATLFVGLAGLALGLVTVGVAPGFGGFLLGRLIMGLGASAAFLAVFAEFLDSAPTASRGRLANAFEAMALVSLAVGGVLAGRLAGAVGWRGGFLVAAGLLALSLASWWSISPGAGRRLDPRSDAGGRGPLTALRAVRGIALASFGLALTWSGLFTTLLPLLGHARHGLDGTALGLALGAGYVAELLGLLGLSLVVDRLRREPVFLTGALVVAVGAGVLAVSTGSGLFVAGVALVGAGLAVWMIPATVLADRSVGAIPPAELAAYRIALDAGMIVGPLGLGALAGLLGDRTAVAVAGLAMLGGALALRR